MHYHDSDELEASAHRLLLQMHTNKKEIMKQTAYSQFEQLALACRKRTRPDREGIEGEAGRDGWPTVYSP